MAKDLSNKPPMSYCEKIYRAAFGRSRRLPKKNDAPNPSLSTTSDHPTPQTRAPFAPKPLKHFVHFSSSNDRDGGLRTFSEEKYNSYIDGTKTKMRCPTDVGGETSVSRCDNFNEMVSSFISHSKVKLTNTSSMG